MARRFADREHVDGGEYFGRLAYLLESRAESEGVDRCGKHAHLVAFDAVEAFGRTLKSAEYIAAAYHDGHFNAGGYYLGDLACVFSETFGIDAIALVAHQRFAAEFEEHSVVFCVHFVGSFGFLITNLAINFHL